MNIHPPTIVNHGLFAEHDMACSVCITGHAVLNMSEGTFQPCWACQGEGWRLAKKPPSFWSRVRARLSRVMRGGPRGVE